MSIEASINTLLSANAAVTTIIGNRIYPVYMPTGTQFPALVIQRISTPRWNTLDNASDTPHARMTFTCWGPTLEQVIKLSYAVKSCIAGFVGTVGNTYIQQVLLIDERDSYLWQAGQMLGLFRRDIDFEIAYEEN